MSTPSSSGAFVDQGFQGDDPFGGPPTVTVRLSDIVAHRKPDLLRAHNHLRALHAGRDIAPLQVDSEWTEHWQSDRHPQDRPDGHGMSSQHESDRGDPPTDLSYLGMGYALVEGEDRLAALIAHRGLGAEVEVIMVGLSPIRLGSNPG